MNKIYGYPTDTVFGIGCRYDDEVARDNIRVIKLELPNKPLSLLFPSLSMLSEFIDIKEIGNKEWLNVLFSLQVTLGIPKERWKKDIPNWITYDSDYVTFRLLGLPELREVFNAENVPIISTSLNLSGASPIINNVEAQSFCNNSEIEIQFIKQTSTVLSGNSSTLIFIENNKPRVVRSGSNVKSIQSHFELLST
jgi:L-threonylcarbamoyladenylate synthase